MSAARAPGPEGAGAREAGRGAEPDFLSGGGEMAALIAAFDWGGTALGPLAGWTGAVKAVVGLILRSPVPLVTLWGEDGSMIYNDAYSVFAGLRHPALLGSKVREGWPEVAAFNDHVMRTGLAGGTLAYRDQELTLHRSGAPEQVWMNLDYSPIPGEDGSPAGVIAVVVETTAKVQAERRLTVAVDALAALNADLEQRVAERTAERDRVWRNSRDLLTVVGADGVFRAANPAWRTILGIAPEEVVGRCFNDFVWPEDAAATRRALEAAASERDLTSFENRYRHADGGARWISWHTSVEGGLVYAYGRDVTAEKRQAEALREMEDQLRQAQKMEAVGQLTGGLAHDFNNLLTGMAGSLELIGKRVAQSRPADVERYLVAARGAVTRAAALTHRLLAFSRQQTLDPRPTDVNALVDGMAELIRRTAGPTVRLETRGAPGLWTAMVDVNQLENALLNLCINARDAMPKGGAMTVETANHVFDARGAALRDLSPGEYVALSVADDGAGMTKEVAARAFDPFFTTKPAGKSSGLGLSMIYGFVRQSGGQARIDSEPGRGTTVSLYLPRHPGEAEAPGRPDPGAEEPRAAAGEAVLVIDDEHAVRMLVCDTLEELGYAVLQACDGKQGLALLEGDARVDLLVTDMGLPGGMNGREVAEAARRLRPGLRVLFITGYAEQAALSRLGLGPGTLVMTKPFALAGLASGVRKAIGGG